MSAPQARATISTFAISSVRLVAVGLLLLHWLSISSVVAQVPSDTPAEQPDKNPRLRPVTALAQGEERLRSIRPAGPVEEHRCLFARIACTRATPSRVLPERHHHPGSPIERVARNEPAELRAVNQPRRTTDEVATSPL